MQTRLKRRFSVFLCVFLILTVLSSVFVSQVYAASTFGKTTIGANTQNWGCYCVGYRFQAPENGTITSLHAYLTGTNGVRKTRAGVYADSNADPVALLQGGPVLQPNGDGWIPYSGFSVPIVAGVWYWFIIRMQSELVRYNDDGIWGYSAYRSATLDLDADWDDPYAQHNNDLIEWSFYATYTTVTGEERTFGFIETLKPSESLSQQQEHQRTFTQTITSSVTMTQWQEHQRIFSQTVTQTETVTYWQEQQRFFTETTAPSISMSHWIEGILQFIEFIETAKITIVAYSFFETEIIVEDVMALAALALVIALAALAIGAVAWTEKRKN